MWHYWNHRLGENNSFNFIDQVHVLFPVLSKKHISNVADSLLSEKKLLMMDIAGA